MSIQMTPRVADHRQRCVVMNKCGAAPPNAEALGLGGIKGVGRVRHVGNLVRLCSPLSLWQHVHLLFSHRVDLDIAAIRTLLRSSF